MCTQSGTLHGIRAEQEDAALYFRNPCSLGSHEDQCSIDSYWSIVEGLFSRLCPPALVTNFRRAGTLITELPSGSD